MKNIINRTCKRCGYEWESRKEDIMVCARCRSPYWNKDKKSKNINLDNKLKELTKKSEYPKPIKRVPLDDIQERMRQLAMKINK